MARSYTNKRATPGPGGLAIRPSQHVADLALEIGRGELLLEDIYVTEGESLPAGYTCVFCVLD
jgi:hypothetical protein